MKLFTRNPDVDAAEAAVADLVATAEKWADAADAATKAIQDLSGRVGDLALDDEAAGAQAAADIARLTSELRIADAAKAAAQARLQLARRVVLIERSKVLRARAVRLEKAVKARQARTAELLAAVSTFEACPYVPDAPSLVPLGMPVGGVTEWRVPLTTAISEHVAWLGSRADEVERQSGALQGDALAAAVATPLPEPSNLDQAVADDGTFTGDPTPFGRKTRSAAG